MKFMQRLGEVINKEENGSLRQSDLHHLVSWAQANSLCFNKVKCNCIQLGTKTVGQTHRMGNSTLGSRD